VSSGERLVEGWQPQGIYRTGLMHLGCRYYDAELGRFIQPDPRLGSLYSPQSLNRYTYCLNSPLNWVDPTGELTDRQEEILEGIGYILIGIGSIIAGVADILGGTKVAGACWIGVGVVSIGLGISKLIPNKPPRPAQPAPRPWRPLLPVAPHLPVENPLNPPGPFGPPQQ
jgi:RHS repeat-associated protein